jgi:hypothetical protein
MRAHRSPSGDSKVTKKNALRMELSIDGATHIQDLNPERAEY